MKLWLEGLAPATADALTEFVESAICGGGGVFTAVTVSVTPIVCEAVPVAEAVIAAV